MNRFLSRRPLLTLGALGVPMAAAQLGLGPNSAGVRPAAQPESGPDDPPVPGDSFPRQPPELAREIVTVSHFNLTRVKELVEARPSLAKAAWDWGFGDWETALGAASHMGNRPIAEYLIAKGAGVSIFSAAMMGHLEAVKAFVAAQPGIQRTAGPHSISLLAHAHAGGEAARPVFEYLKSLGDAGAQPEAPLAENDRSVILGTYVFGPRPADQVDVTFEKERLTWTRKGTVGRWIFHLGGLVFYPSGAPAVQIRFSEKDGARMMTVNDPELVLVAKMRRAAA